MTPEIATETEGVRPTPKHRTGRQARKYGFACANCRRRKARCDGGIPNCNRCIANNDACHYNKAPSIAHAVALQNHVKASETLLSQLRNANDSDRLRILEEHFSLKDDHSRNKRATTVEDGLGGSPQSEVSVEDELSELLNETSVDEDGRICFYGTTSNLHIPPPEATFSRSSNVDTPGTVRTVPDETEHWYHHPQDQHGNGSSTTEPSPNARTHQEPVLTGEVAPELLSELLDTYWCWPHHLHLVLCRKVFMRDLHSSGPYVTPFLLNAVLSQAARYYDHPESSKISQHFARRALDTLPRDLDNGSSIPTIQGLLIFSARECACGRTSQGWLYSGMAFRMMRDIGIHIHPRKLTHLAGQYTPEELALRQQVFWSCYTWDKTMSLCLGRAPTIHEVMPLPVLDQFIDGDAAEDEVWKPKFADSSALEVGLTQRSNTHSRFLAYCKLCMIIDDVLGTLYSHPHTQQHHLRGFLERELRALEQWVQELPSHLYIKEHGQATTCPPLHTLLLNLLYHATIILLCRPYRSAEVRAREKATTAAEMIDHLFMLHIRRFGFRVISYLESYTMFVASTINLLDLKERINEENARARLALTFEVFRNAKSTPSNVRCAEIIEQLLRKDENPTESSEIGERGFSTVNHSAVDPSTMPAQNHSTWMQTASTFPTLPARGVDPADDFSFVDTTIFNEASHTTLADPTAMPSQVGSSNIETPVRWLPENLGDDHAWMMMSIDFGGAMNAGGSSFSTDQ